MVKHLNYFESGESKQFVRMDHTEKKMRSSKRVAAISGIGWMRSVSTKSHSHASTCHKYALLTVMYLSQAVPMGFIMAGLPVIMRSGGMSLKSIGFLFMLHLPWAFKFIYASYVDSRYLQRLGRRRTWILPMQWLVVLLFVVLSQTPSGSSFPVMFILCLLVALALATNDIAVDGYATDILTESERPWGNSIQAGSRSVGIILGGGIPLVLFEALGWQVICLLIAVMLCILHLPVLFHREIQVQAPQHAASENQPAKIENMLSLLKNGQTMWLLIFLTVPTVFYFLSFQMRLPLLNDLGLSPQAMGMAMIWCGAPGGVLGSLLGGYLFQRIGAMHLMRWYVLAALGMSAFSIHLTWQAPISQWCGLLTLALDNFLLGAVHVWCFTLMMKASAGAPVRHQLCPVQQRFSHTAAVISPAVPSVVGDALWISDRSFLLLTLSGLLTAGL